MSRFLILLIFCATVFAAACGTGEETHAVEEHTLREAVYASGEILPFEYEYAVSTTSDRIHQILVQEGDTVRAGQVLAVMGTPSDQDQLGILSSQLALARENASEDAVAVAELEQKIALAKATYEQDSLNAKRYTELAATQAVSRKQAEDATIRATASLTEYTALRQQRTSLRNTLDNQVLAAENQLAQFRRGRENQVLTSRVDGRVYSVHMETGEIARPNEPIILVGTPGKFRLELLVDERDISKVELGQKVLFETDAYTGRQFTGRVIKIMPVLQRETRSFEIDVEVLDEGQFFPQTSVEANIIVRDSTPVLSIPTEYLLGNDSVWVRTESGDQKAGVQTGVRDGQFVEITNGLQKGSIVVKKQP